MPSIQETIVAHLKADSAFVALVGDRLHPGQIPDHEPASPWVYFLVTDASPRAELSSSGEIDATVTFDVLADDYEIGRNVVLVIYSLLHGFAGGQIERALWTGTRESAVDGGYAFEVTFRVFGIEAAVVPTSSDLPRVEVREDGLYFNGSRLTTADQLYDDRYGRLNATNNWVGNQIVNGTVIASYFAGDASALTNLPTETSGQSVLALSFNATGAEGVFQDTGLSVTLPKAGTYLLTYNVRIAIQSTTPTSAGYLVVRLWDIAASAEIPNTRRLTLFSADQNNRQIHTAYSTIAAVGSARTVRLEVSRNGGASWALSQIASNSDGWTTLGYVRLG